MKRRNVTLLVFILAIGFASVSTTLVLNGTLNLGFNVAEFDADVIFTRAVTPYGNAAVAESKKIITFETERLENVNDKANLEFDITNKSRDYDASVEISCGLTKEFTSFSEYVTIEIDLNNPFELTAGSTKRGNLTVELVKAYNESLDEEIEFECRLIATPIERDTLGSVYEAPEVYKEPILNGADPVLMSGKTRDASSELIPVMIDNKGVVTYADVKEEWYNYENKEWANAVILVDNPSKEYNVGNIIKESDIESYFVWIPKYSYQLWDIGNYNSLTEVDDEKVHEIPIRFGLSETDDLNEGECTTPMNEERTQALSGETGNCQVGDYMTHPAFISMNTNGLWVGKFETGYKGETPGNINSSDKVQIKPNVYSWGSIQIANAHLTSYNYKREMDSHMMKNTEWGAVAYLQHSQYGSAKSVRNNNNTAYITGYASVNEPTLGCGAYTEHERTNLGLDGEKTINYNNPGSQVASTTGNYSGIYDMSGGQFEYTLSFMKDRETGFITGRSSSLNSGFSGKYVNGSIITTGTDIPESKYWDMYSYWSNDVDYRNRILGDATGEIGPFASKAYSTDTRRISSWYEDESRMFPSTVIPFTIRGGDVRRGVGAGIFTTDNHNIEGTYYYGFRIVLAI